MARKAAKSVEKPEMNKSQTIREYVVAHPDDGPTAVANALNKAHEWEISPAYVSTIKNKMKAPASQAAVSASPAGGLDEQALLQAKQLAKQAGGFDKAKAMLDLVARLSD